jgi:hypothetical protein
MEVTVDPIALRRLPEQGATVLDALAAMIAAAAPGAPAILAARAPSGPRRRAGG